LYSIEATTGTFTAVVAAASRRAISRVPGESKEVSASGVVGGVLRADSIELGVRTNTIDDFEPEASSRFDLLPFQSG